jgi:hypothetical protein
VKRFIIHEILPGLYQRGHLEAWSADYKYDVLADYNITLVFGLFTRPDPDLPYWPNGTYIHRHLPDGKRLDPEPYLELARRAATVLVPPYPPPPRDALGAVYGGLAGARSRAPLPAPGAVLSTCHAGRNRSGLLNALIVREITGCSGKDAIDIVRAGRPRAIANPTFVSYLESLP